jgi:pimeloyl-ACP methyl ester carboxylesterase
MAAVATPEPAATSSRDPRGVWQGKLQGALRIVVHVGGDSAGGLTSTIDSPDQGATGLPVSTVSFAHDTLTLELASLGASFAGVMNDEATEIVGEWHQSGQSIPLNLARGDAAPTSSRPQEPRKPYPYAEEDVSYPGGAQGVRLSGTLTRPNGAGPFPAVLLITGSGPEDRDEQVFGHRPFLVIADHLTRNGIAVLRMDDRGVGGSTGSSTQATSEDFAADVLAGVKFLGKRSGIDAKHIGLIGHSEGGLIAPMVATRSKQVAFIVLLAGPGVPGEQILYAQGEAISRALGKSEQQVARQRRVQEKLFAIIRQDLDSAAVVDRVREIFRAEQIDAATSQSQIPVSVGMARSPWFRYFLSYDPRPTLRRLKCPVLALNGEKDVQVPPRQNLPEIEKALESSRTRDFETRELPGLNHLFQTCTTGAPTEYGAIEETFAPVALDAITEWIQAHTAGGR